MTTSFLYEPDPALARVSATIGAGQVLQSGTVVGRINLGEVASAAGAGNAGDGTIGLHVEPRAWHCKVGRYRIECVTEIPGGGVFRVTDPAGFDVGYVAAGEEHSRGIRFTVTAGEGDFRLGDHFTVDVAKGSGRLVQLDPAGVDGRQTPTAILAEDVDTTEGEVIAYVIGRPGSVIHRAALIWPEGYTNLQKAAALQELDANGIRAIY